MLSRTLRTSRIPTRQFTTTTRTLKSKNNTSSMPSNMPKGDASKPVFNKEGAVGKQFQADGAIGGAAQKIGGPLDKDGAIGKNFNADRADSKLGGTVNETLGKSSK